MLNYDESTNPSNGWQTPEMPDELAGNLQDLEPHDENPLESNPLAYNPLNHAYPMIADTSIGTIEVMVKFAVIRGKENLPIDLLTSARELQVPAVIEDVPVTAPQQPQEQQFYGESFSGWKPSPEDAVAEGALAEEIQGGSFYLVPTIVRARRFTSGEPGSTESWEPLSEDEIAGVMSGPSLLDLICGYAEKVANDPNAPKGLLDMLDHFTGKAGRNQEKYPGVEDEEWNDGNEEWN